MSIHVRQTPEALAQLRRQRRATLVGSIACALGLALLIGLILALVTFAPIFRETPVIISYSTPSVDEQQLEQTKLTTARPKPQAPASHATNVIASSAPAPTAIPTIDLAIDEPSLEFGAGDDFGDGFLDAGDGFGAAGGASGGFGSTQRISGALTGSLYDFKQNRRRRPNEDESDPDQFAGIVERLQRRDFSDSAFSRYFKAPNELSLTHLAIPRTDAREGPKHFGAEEYMEPRMWLAHYAGDVVALEPGTYRFVGIADDYVSVFLDGDPVLIAHRPDTSEEIRMNWKPAEESGRWAPPFAEIPLFVGDWVEFEPGQPRHLDLSIGERPGGALAFILMIQKQGEEYHTAKDGRPILPLFTTAPFSEEQRASIDKMFKNYGFEWDKVPVFPAQ